MSISTVKIARYMSLLDTTGLSALRAADYMFFPAWKLYNLMQILVGALHDGSCIIASDPLQKLTQISSPRVELVFYQATDPVSW